MLRFLIVMMMVVMAACTCDDGGGGDHVPGSPDAGVLTADDVQTLATVICRTELRGPDCDPTCLAECTERVAERIGWACLPRQ